MKKSGKDTLMDIRNLMDYVTILSMEHDAPVTALIMKLPGGIDHTHVQIGSNRSLMMVVGDNDDLWITWYDPAGGHHRKPYKELVEDELDF